MAGFIQNYVDCITKKFCKFSGRANRSEYWLFVLANLIVEILLYILMAIIGFGAGSAGGALAIYALIVIYGIAIILPSLGLTVRRLHDSGRGGGWIFIALIPLIGALVLLFFMIVDGTEGENRFGARPE